MCIRGKIGEGDEGGLQVQVRNVNKSVVDGKLSIEGMYSTSFGIWHIYSCCDGGAAQVEGWIGLQHP
jgi:hypothetical protein